MQTQFNWISINDSLPTMEGYYKVKYQNGDEDEKPFRIRPNKNIYGFMTSQIVTHWANIYYNDVNDLKDEKEVQIWNCCISEAIIKAKLSCRVLDKDRVAIIISKLETLKI